MRSNVKLIFFILFLLVGFLSAFIFLKSFEEKKVNTKGNSVNSLFEGTDNEGELDNIEDCNKVSSVFYVLSEMEISTEFNIDNSELVFKEKNDEGFVYELLIKNTCKEDINRILFDIIEEYELKLLEDDPSSSKGTFDSKIQGNDRNIEDYDFDGYKIIFVDLNSQSLKLLVPLHWDYIGNGILESNDSEGAISLLELLRDEVNANDFAIEVLEDGFKIEKGVEKTTGINSEIYTWMISDGERTLQRALFLSGDLKLYLKANRHTLKSEFDFILNRISDEQN